MMMMKTKITKSILKAHKKHGVFVLDKYSWVWELLWNTLDIPSDDHLEKVDFPSSK